MENTIKKQNWLSQKWNQFKAWKRKQDLKTNKKPTIQIVSKPRG